MRDVSLPSLCPILLNILTLTRRAPAGHEAPYIIVSAVRTSGAGFMKSLNRMNVMLTRCQAGMVIVTKRAFLHHTSTGKKALLGALAEHWQKRVGPADAWADAMEVADGRTNLPSAPATKVAATVWDVST